MKLNKIASAVSISLAALALTACGGSSKSNTTPVVTTPSTNDNAAQIEKEQANIRALTAQAIKDGLSPDNAAKFAHENKALVVGSDAYKKAVEEAIKKQNAANAGGSNSNDPVSGVVEQSNHFIDGYDAKITSSVSAGHYARQTDSTFDRSANKIADGSSGYSTTITTNEQNPYLTNYVLGSESFSKDSNGLPNRDAVDVIGAYVIGKKPSTVAQAKGKDTVFEYTVVRHDGTTADVDSEAHYKTLQDVNKINTKVEAGDVVDVFKAVKNGTVGGLKSGLEAYSSVAAVESPVFGVAENTYENKSGKLVVSNKVDDMNALNNRQIVANALPGAVVIDGNAVANNYSVRIFGKNYIDYENGATIDPKETTNNSYVALYQDNEHKNLTALKVNKLHNVQYGRLTTNIDTLASDPSNKKLDYVYREFEQHGSDASVDRYFYRGTNETSITDMQKVVTKGGTLEYFGHALTYGLGPTVSSNGQRVIPTAFGPASPATIGNFVHAKYDTKAAKVNGSIYNLVSKDVSVDNPVYSKQDLATFTGNVHGNTAFGSSTKLGVNETGSFIASFYGSGAEEMGGQISSITREQGYGSPKWGAVFGASQLASGANYNTGAVGSTAGGHSSNATTTTTKP